MQGFCQGLIPSLYVGLTSFLLFRVLRHFVRGGADDSGQQGVGIVFGAGPAVGDLVDGLSVFGGQEADAGVGGFPFGQSVPLPGGRFGAVGGFNAHRVHLHLEGDGVPEFFVRQHHRIAVHGDAFSFEVPLQGQQGLADCIIIPGKGGMGFPEVHILPAEIFEINDLDIFESKGAALPAAAFRARRQGQGQQGQEQGGQGQEFFHGCSSSLVLSSHFTTEKAGFQWLFILTNPGNRAIICRVILYPLWVQCRK